MRRNRQIAITLIAFGAGMIAFVGFCLRNGYDQHEPRAEDAGEPSGSFWDFKTEKKKVMEAYHGVVGDSSKAASLIFCWNEASEKYEVSNLNLAGGAITAHDNFSKQEYTDIDRDGLRESYDLNDGRLIVREDSRTIWESDDGWWVENFALADSDGDGAANLNLSVWKSGSFGKYKPFWIKEDDPSVKNHLFVFAFRDNDMKPVWQSSNLSAPNCYVSFSDLDADGRDELIVLEGSYSQIPDCKGEYISVWKWNEWGFINEWRSGRGEFGRLGIYDMEGKKCVAGF